MPRKAVSALISPRPARSSSISGFTASIARANPMFCAPGMLAVLMPTTSPSRVDQRPARVAGVDGRVGLDQVLPQAGFGLDAAVLGRDDAEGHARLHAEAERVADGHDGVAHLERVGRPEPGRHQVVAVLHADHRHVLVGKGPDQLGLRGRAVDEHDVEVGGAGDHVVVRDDQAVGAEDEPGSRGGRALDRDHRRLGRVEQPLDVEGLRRRVEVAERAPASSSRRSRRRSRRRRARRPPRRPGHRSAPRRGGRRARVGLM